MSLSQQSYRLSSHMGLEVLFSSVTTTSPLPVFDFDAEGLKSISFENFSGSILIHRRRNDDVLGGAMPPDGSEYFDASSSAFSVASSTRYQTPDDDDEDAINNDIEKAKVENEENKSRPTLSNVAVAPLPVPMHTNSRDGGNNNNQVPSPRSAFPATETQPPLSTPPNDNGEGPNLADEPLSNEFSSASGDSDHNSPPQRAVVATGAVAAVGIGFAENNNIEKTQSNDTQDTTDTVKRAMVKFKGKKSKNNDDDDDDDSDRKHHMLTKQLGGIIKSVMNQNSMKRNIPEHIRMRRMERRSYLSPTSFNSNDDDDVSTLSASGIADPDSAIANNKNRGLPPTPLHQMCAEPSCTLQDLLDCLRRYPQAIRTKDSRGRYPLHILGDNETLITAVNGGKSTATTFGTHLIHEFPLAILAADDNDSLPFFDIIDDWITWANQERSKDMSYTARSDFHDDKSYCYPGTTSSKRLEFPRVELWEETEWCFHMLTTAIEILGRNLVMPTFQHTRRSLNRSKNHKDERVELVEKLVQKMPNLFPTLLLVDDDGLDSRVRALETQLFRRMLLCKDTVGKWLTNMLNHGGVPARRGVDFLAMVSGTSIDDYTGGFGAPLPSDWNKFRGYREEVFDAVCELKGSLASLVTLKVRETERAASTAVVWHSMGNKLSRPFTLGLVLIDLVLHISLMINFRNDAGVKPPLPQQHEKVITSSGVIYTISTHYYIRTLSEAWAMWAVSRGALRGYIFDMWNIFGLTAISLTVVTTMLNAYDGKNRSGMNALAVGLLWIKVLGFLKVVNKEMATFILALSQILYDIRFFMLVLFVFIFMFGDMFHISVSEKDDGQWCAEENQGQGGSIDDFCSSSYESYLRTYAILLGDFDLDDMTATTATTILFLLFTVFGIIILLNVLIAIISDSYEKAQLRGHVLFGRARVMFVAQNEALENFLKPRRRKVNPMRPFLSRGKIIARWLMLIVVLTTAFFTLLFIGSTCVALGGSNHASDIFYFIFSFILGALLLLALWVVIAFVLDEFFRWLLPDNAEGWYDWIGKINLAVVRGIAGWLFGLEKERVESSITSKDGEDEQEWTGRMNYVAEAVGEMISDAKRELKQEIMELKQEVHSDKQDQQTF